MGNTKKKFRKKNPSAQAESYSKLIKNLTACITSPANKVVWRSNPSDPFIYITFSRAQWLQIYADRDKDLAKLITLIKDFNDDIIQSLKKIIDAEWIARAKLPIKYLSFDENPKNLSKKNILFIFSQQQQAKSKKTIDFQISSRIPGEYKIIMFEDLLSVESITPRTINMFLHETAHALIGAKHFRPSTAMDANLSRPYCRGKNYGERSLDCTRTVMAYTDDCPPVIDKEFQLLGEKRVSIHDPDPSVQKIVKAVFSAYPTTLGDIDLAAAKQFLQQWEQQNRQKNLPHQDIDNTPSTIHTELCVAKETLGKRVTQGTTSFINSFFVKSTNYLLDCLTDACQKLGEDLQTCNSYFPKLLHGAPSHYSTSHLQFFNTSLANETLSQSSIHLNNAAIVTEEFAQVQGSILTRG